MANSMYGLGREAFLVGSIDALTDTLALAMFTTAYTPNLTTDQFYSTPVASSGLVGSKVSLTSVTGALGTLSAGNVTFTSVSGSTASYLVLFKDTGTNSTSPLIGLIDTASGLPVTPNGGNITVAWSGGQVFTLFESLAEAERDRGMLARLKELMKHLRDRKWSTSPGGLLIPEPSIVMG